MCHIGSRATLLEKREYSSSDYVSYRSTTMAAENEWGDRITAEYECAYGMTREWLCFDGCGMETYPFHHYGSHSSSPQIVGLSCGNEYAASVCDYRFVDVFCSGKHLGLWDTEEQSLRDLGTVELLNADVASRSGWVCLEWDSKDLFDCVESGSDFSFRTGPNGKRKHLPRLLPLGRLLLHPDAEGLRRLAGQSGSEAVRLAAAVLLSDPNALAALRDSAGDSTVREKCAERLSLYGELGYFPPDKCELVRLSEKEKDFWVLYEEDSELCWLDEEEDGAVDPLTPLQLALSALSHPLPRKRSAAMKELGDTELFLYMGSHDHDPDVQFAAMH